MARLSNESHPDCYSTFLLENKWNCYNFLFIDTSRLYGQFWTLHIFDLLVELYFLDEYTNILSQQRISDRFN